MDEKKTKSRAALHDLPKSSEPVTETEFDCRSADNMALPFTIGRTTVGLGKEEHIGIKTAHLITGKLFQGEMKTNWN